MRSICVYCNILFDVKEPYDNDAETHGICPWCWPIVKAQLEEHKNPISPETAHKTLIPSHKGTGRESVRES